MVLFKLRDTRKSRGELSQVLVEPGDRSIHSVDLILWLDEEMALARIDYDLGRHAERSQSVPEFVRLRGRAFRVALTDDDQGRCLHIFDEVNGGTLLVNGGIVVDRRTEEGNHPLINQVLAVIALPIGNAGAGHGT